MTAQKPNAELAYRVTFERIGCNHYVGPLDVRADDAETLAKKIYDFGRKFLGSRYVDVEVDMEHGRGEFICGIRCGGRFTFEVMPS